MNIKLITIALIISAIGLKLHNKYVLPQSIKIEVGKSYLLPLNWHEKNPFKESVIDTVSIIDIQDGYVKYEHKFIGYITRQPRTITTSCRISTLELLIKPIK